MASAEFNQAAEDVKNLSKTPDNSEMLKLYGLFKQVTVGDCNTDKPGLFDVAGKKKWEAWNELKGKKTSAEAEAEYIAYVKELQAKYN